MCARKVKERQKEKLLFHLWRTVYHILRPPRKGENETSRILISLKCCQPVKGWQPG